MALIALTLYVTGLLLAFGVRTLLAWRRTGDTGFRRPDPTAFTPAWWGSVLFVAALALGLAAPLAVVVGQAGPTGWLAHPMLNGTGAAVMAAGLALVLISQAAMGASWRIGVEETEQTDLVTNGIFTVVRNPIFTAMGVLLTGMVTAIPTLLSAVALLVFACAVQIQVRAVEEPYLLRIHGAAYRAYAARTGRFLPGIGRLTTAGTPSGGADG